MVWTMIHSYAKKTCSKVFQKLHKECLSHQCQFKCQLAVHFIKNADSFWPVFAMSVDILKLNFRVARLLFTLWAIVRSWTQKERNCCHFNCATFCLPWARSLCCLSKDFVSKKRKKFFDGQWSGITHGKRNVAQLKWQLLLFVDRQSIIQIVTTKHI